MKRSLKRALARRRWRPCDAEVVLEALASSGQSMSAFAIEHGLEETRLRRWPGRLRLRAEGEVDDELDTASDRPPVLLPVYVVGSAVPPELTERESPTHAARTLDVSVGVGRVQVPVDFDADHLRRIVEVLARC